MIIKLVGVSVAELELALRYSGLFVETREGHEDYAEIKAIPAFLQSESNNVRCGCEAYRQLAELKDKVKEMQGKVRSLGSLEFWEELGDKHGLGLDSSLDSSLDLDSVSDFINSEVK